MLFQKVPDMQAGNVLSVAWITKFTHPASVASFIWSLNYNFVWSETGYLSPGILFASSQILPADLNETNYVELTYSNGAYNFRNQKASGVSGNLQITQDNTIPLKQAMVGIGMSGSPTFVVNAQPNMNLTFTPHPEYWIAFGNFNAGEVIDVQAISNAAKIDFPPGIVAMNVTLNQDNTWEITPSAD